MQEKELNGLTFNDLPQAVSLVLDKVSNLEQEIQSMREDIKSNRAGKSMHIPMNIDEACEYLKMKKATMYYHLQRGAVPATRTGKSYIFFKDELTIWIESGWKSDVPPSTEEINNILKKRSRSK